MKSLLVGLVAILTFAPQAYAANIVYDEFSQGDLSTDSLNPTPLNLSLGSNHVIGSTTGNPNLDRDFWTLTIPSNYILSKVIVAEYVGLDDVGINQGFFSVQAGSRIEPGTVSANDPPLLGAALIGNDPGTLVGDNILEALGKADPIQGSTFIGFPGGTLGPGTYTFWIQETVNGIQRYNLDFVVSTVPEPSIIMGMGIVLGGGMFMKRKKRLAE